MRGRIVALVAVALVTLGGLVASTEARPVGAADPGANRQIAFHSSRDDSNPQTCSPCNYEVYVMNADGGGQMRLTNNPAFDGGPTWSPKGTMIAFQTNRDVNVEIYRMKPMAVSK